MRAVQGGQADERAECSLVVVVVVAGRGLAQLNGRTSIVLVHRCSAPL